MKNLIDLLTAAADVLGRYSDVSAQAEQTRLNLIENLRATAAAMKARLDTPDTPLAALLASDPFDNDFALMEGWDLFDVDGRLQLQRIDSPHDHGAILPYTRPKFATDTDGIIHVAHLAQAGSFYHRDALKHIGTLVEG